MKKVFTIVAFAAITTFVACGPSADETAEKARVADSTAKAEADALEMEAANAQQALDSTATANADTTKAMEAAPEHK